MLHEGYNSIGKDMKQPSKFNQRNNWSNSLASKNDNLQSELESGLQDMLMNVYNKKLSPGIYSIKEIKSSNKNSNSNEFYYLEPKEDKFVTNNKIYGDSMYRVTRYWNRFATKNKNCGVLLYGDSGAGKTLDGKLLSNIAIDHGLPVVEVVNINVTTRLISFIDSLEDCVIFLDEFSKNVPYHMQQKILSIMSEAVTSKKFYILTENDKAGVSSYIVGRLGRAFYSRGYTKLDKDVVIGFLDDNNVKEEFKNDLLDAYNKSTKFTMDTLSGLIEEHKDYPNETLEEMLKFLNVELTTKDYMIVLDKVIKYTIEGDETKEKVLDNHNSNPVSYHMFREHGIAPVVNLSGKVIKLTSSMITYVDEETIIYEYEDKKYIFSIKESKDISHTSDVSNVNNSPRGMLNIPFGNL